MKGYIVELSRTRKVEILSRPHGRPFQSVKFSKVRMYMHERQKQTFKGSWSMGWIAEDPLCVFEHHILHKIMHLVPGGLVASSYNNLE